MCFINGREVTSIEFLQFLERRERRGGFEPIPDGRKPCAHPGHKPPMHLFIPPYMQFRHVCPGCGYEVVLRGSQVTL